MTLQQAALQATEKYFFHTFVCLNKHGMWPMWLGPILQSFVQLTNFIFKVFWLLSCVAFFGPKTLLFQILAIFCEYLEGAANQKATRLYYITCRLGFNEKNSHKNKIEWVDGVDGHIKILIVKEKRQLNFSLLLQRVEIRMHPNRCFHIQKGSFNSVQMI